MRVSSIIQHSWQRISPIVGPLWQRPRNVLFATTRALPYLAPIILVFLLVWFAAGTPQVGDAIGAEQAGKTILEQLSFSFFTARRIVLFWGVLTASTWVLVEVALSHLREELPNTEDLLNTLRFLVSCFIFFGVITLPHYSAQWWWWVLAPILVALTYVAQLLWKKHRGSSNNQVQSDDGSEPIPWHVGIVALLVFLAVGVVFQVVQFHLDQSKPKFQFRFPVRLLISYLGFYFFIVTAVVLIRKLIGLIRLIRKGSVIRNGSGYVRGPKQLLAILPKHPLAILFGGAALIFLCAVGDPRLAHLCGIPSLLLLTSSAWIILLTVAMFASDKSKWPVLGFLLLWGPIMTLIPGASFQHAVRTSNASDAKERPSSEFGDAYKSWLAVRHKVGTAPYDVYIVLAEGGGIRAAYQTAITLAYLEDLQSGFHEHVFAISGVSGGSVGAAVFSALCHLDDMRKWPKDETGKPKSWKNLVDDVFSRDLLAAPVGALMGREVFQCWLPFGWLGQRGVNWGLALDRSIALETSLESAFFGSTGHNVLAEPFYFDPNKNRPLLLMNATRTVTGQRAVISPVLLKSDKGAEYPFAMYPLTENAAPRLQLSTAAVISARFPLISPTARLSLGHGEPISLVDGGYLDNTGALTAKAVLDEMKGLLDTDPESPYKIHLIIPRFKPFTKTTYDQVQQNQSRYQLLEKKGKKEVYLDRQTGQQVTVEREKEERSELDELVQTFLNVHSAYNSSLAPTEEALGKGKYPEQQRGEVFVVTFVEDEKLRQPLGWLISPNARKSLLSQLEKKTCDRCSALDYLRLWQK
jgi:hypothetical protein